MAPKVLKKAYIKNHKLEFFVDDYGNYAYQRTEYISQPDDTYSSSLLTFTIGEYDEVEEIYEEDLEKLRKL